jgi:hypothetical protein
VKGEYSGHARSLNHHPPPGLLQPGIQVSDASMPSGIKDRTYTFENDRFLGRADKARSI